MFGGDAGSSHPGRLRLLRGVRGSPLIIIALGPLRLLRGASDAGLRLILRVQG